MRIHLQRLLALQRLSVGMHFLRQSCHYVYCWHDFLFVYGLGVERLTGRKGRTTHQPSSIFFRFQKRPPWLNLKTYSRSVNVFFKKVKKKYAWVFRGQPCSGYNSDCTYGHCWNCACKWSVSCNNIWGLRETFYVKMDPHARNVHELLVYTYNIPANVAETKLMKMVDSLVYVSENTKILTKENGAVSLWRIYNHAKLVELPQWNSLPCAILSVKNPTWALAWDWSKTFVVSGRRLNVWSMARPTEHSNNISEIGVNGET